jgi:hypothetical protein
VRASGLRDVVRSATVVEPEVDSGNVPRTTIDMSQSSCFFVRL